MDCSIRKWCLTINEDPRICALFLLGPKLKFVYDPLFGSPRVRLAARSLRRVGRMRVSGASWFAQNLKKERIKATGDEILALKWAFLRTLNVPIRYFIAPRPNRQLHTITVSTF